MKFLSFLLPLITLFLPGCIATGGGPKRAPLVPFSAPRPEKRIYLHKDRLVWRTMEDVRNALGASVKISGTTVDLKGAELNGGQLPKPKDPQNEKAVGVKIYVPGFTLKNGESRSVPGGYIAFVKNVTFLDVLFREPGEDFVSNQKNRSPGFRVINCGFEDTRQKADKATQINDGTDAVVEDCEYRGFETAVRIGESTGKNGDALVKDTTFDGSATAINVDGGTRLTLQNNTFTRVGLELKKGKATIIRK